ncbi:hypothetical protein PFISCL1PPCAC_23724, partial [Pristionchus fissidentatus]
FSPSMSYNQNPGNYDNYKNTYGRQESAASMESLGHAYTEEMKSMLETPIDLANYLLDDDWPVDDNPPMEQQQPSEKQQTTQYYQEQVQLQQALYHDFSDTHYNNFDDYSPNYEQPQQQQAQNYVEVKSEVDMDEEYAKYENGSNFEKESTYDKESSPMPSTSRQIFAIPKKRDAAKALMDYKPQTKARGYKIKAEEEKTDPGYKLKRARNNDAVRKSRTKAKEHQVERDRELNQYKAKCANLEKENKALKARLSRYE